MCSAHLTRSASLWCPGMSTAKCWNFGHIGVAPSSASSCKVSSTPRSTGTAPALFRPVGRSCPPSAPAAPGSSPSSARVFPRTSHLWLYTRPLAAGVRGEDPKGGCPLGPRIQLASRRCGVAPPCLHRPTRGQLIGSDHMTHREADALLYYPLPCLALPYARAVVWTPSGDAQRVLARAQCPRCGRPGALAYSPDPAHSPTLSIQASPAA